MGKRGADCSAKGKIWLGVRREDRRDERRKVPVS